MNKEKIIFTIVGPHAKENLDDIFSRKKRDIKKEGKTFWVIKRIKQKKPNDVQEFCKNPDVKIYFISPATKDGAQDTKSNTKNKEYSEDNKCWNKLPISKVTGTGKDCAFILDSLEMKNNCEIDINHYAEESHKPVEFLRGASTICAIKEDMTSHPNRLKSNIRKVWAVGTLKYPY